MLRSLYLSNIPCICILFLCIYFLFRMSEFEAHSVKLGHLLSEVGVPPTLPYQSSHSCITCPSGLPTPGK